MSRYALLKAALAWQYESTLADLASDGWILVDTNEEYDAAREADPDASISARKYVRRALAEVMRESTFNMFDLHDFPAGYDLSEVALALY